jgi:amino acid permease
MPLKRTLTSIGILAGATIGAGVFTLPYIANRAGWPLFFLYLVLLGIFVAGTHLLYWRVIEKTGDSARLVGLAKKYLHPALARLAFISTILGLAFTLSIYILLGGHFLARVFPLSGDFAAFLFWVGVSIPLLLNLRRFIRVELFITFLMIAAVLGVVFIRPISLSSAPLLEPHDWFFPFGPLLFALAGWTALEPMVARYQQFSATSSRKRGPGPALTIAIGTAVIALIYTLFAFGITKVSTQVTADTFTGLGAVPVWYLILLFLFGLCAIVTSYLPMSHEVKNTLQEDLHWTRSLALPAVLFFPYIMILMGLNNFVILVDLVGGVFLALQYLTILLVARRVLQLQGLKRLALDVLAVVFLLAIVYQFYYLLG